MNIDLFIIRESKRIRRDYLDSLTAMIKKEDELLSCLSEIEDIRLEVENNSEIKEEDFKEKLFLIEKKIKPLQDILNHHKKIIENLDNDQRNLYKKINELYPNVDFELIKNEILKSIEPIDMEFAIKNVDLYKQIKNKKENE